VPGNIELLRRHLISIVGARRPTPSGNQMAERLARDLARARGCRHQWAGEGVDSCAHTGALKTARGATIGVLESGVNVVYPNENKKTFADREAREPSSANSRGARFPRRRTSRFASGSSRVAGGGSSRGRAGLRLVDQRATRDGIRLRGFWRSSQSDPTHQLRPNQLIKQRAKLVMSWEDVIEELPTPIRAELGPVESASPEERAALLDESFCAA
jgi:DNA processing protein